MKTSRAGQKRYELKKGRRTEIAGDDILYRFPFTDKIEREDQVEIQVDQRRVEGAIASIGAGYLILALKEDIGDEVSSAVLLIYTTAFLEALKEKNRSSQYRRNHAQPHSRRRGGPAGSLAQQTSSSNPSEWRWF